MIYKATLTTNVQYKKQGIIDTCRELGLMPHFRNIQDGVDVIVPCNSLGDKVLLSLIN